MAEKGNDEELERQQLNHTDRGNQDSVALPQPLPTHYRFHQRLQQPPMSALGHQPPLSPRCSKPDRWLLRP
jgi:hypothetical protein